MPETDFHVNDVVVLPDADWEVAAVDVDDSAPGEDYPPVTITMRQRAS